MIVLMDHHKPQAFRNIHWSPFQENTTASLVLENKNVFCENFSLMICCHCPTLLIQTTNFRQHQPRFLSWTIACFFWNIYSRFSKWLERQTTNILPLLHHPSLSPCSSMPNPLGESAALATSKDVNIDNYKYIDISILWIFKKKVFIDLKLIKIHENVRKI